MKRALLVLSLVLLTQPGCIGLALLDAGARETGDHGKHARYRHQSFGEHFIDALGDQVTDDDDC